MAENTTTEVKLDHNPVRGVCAGFNKTSAFTINTFNVGNEVADIVEAALKLPQLSQDIIFLQESNKKVKESGAYHEYIYKTQPQKNIGILVKKSLKFEREPTEQDKERHCTVIIYQQDEPDKKIVAISWHGPSTATGEDKKTAFDNLLEFAKDVSKNNNDAPVIIGGDFNFEEDKVKECLKDNNQFKVAAPNALIGVRLGQKNIDFFVHSSDLEIAMVDSIDIKKELHNAMQTEEIIAGMAQVQMN